MRALVIIAIVFFNPISLGIIGFGIATYDQSSKDLRELRSTLYPTSCGSYHRSSTWGRWTNPALWKKWWCEEYLDQMN